ncbi:MAG: WXG100 family type VII secretion target [Anaerolineales bacterium]
MANVRKLNYDDLQNIVNRFRSEAQEIDGMLKQTQGKVESLHNNQWIGQGADKFFNDMEQTVLPATSRLVIALGTAGDVVQKIETTIRSADESTKSYFNNLI